MSSYVFYIKQNDRRPSLVAYLRNYDGTPLDLTTASAVTFSMVKVGGTTPKIDSITASIESAENGEVSYEWQDGDTDTNGTYRGEFSVTWDTGVTQTIPEDDYIKIVVKNDL